MNARQMTIRCKLRRTELLQAQHLPGPMRWRRKQSFPCPRSARIGALIPKSRSRRASRPAAEYPWLDAKIG